MLKKHCVYYGVCLFSAFLSQASLSQESDEPIRLEATIRGNKEQPQVLSIVPWQLPEHREIAGTLTWPVSEMTLTPITRKSFTRQVAWSQQLVTPKAQNTNVKAQP